MTGLVMQPRVVPVGDGVRSVLDTVAACGGTSKAYRYCHAQAKPNFPVPTIPLEVWIDDDRVIIRKSWYKKQVAHWFK